MRETNFLFHVSVFESSKFLYLKFEHLLRAGKPLSLFIRALIRAMETHFDHFRSQIRKS